MTTRIRRTRDQWQQLISNQQQSNLSQAAFCARQNISLASFSNWKRKLHNDSSRTDTIPSWIELPALSSVSTSGWDMELDLGHGVCLRLKASG